MTAAAGRTEGPLYCGVIVCVSFSDQDDLFMSRVNKLKVTMISWSCNDRFIITAANDTAVRIWDSTDFSLLHMLRVCN